MQHFLVPVNSVSDVELLIWLFLSKTRPHRFDKDGNQCQCGHGNLHAAGEQAPGSSILNDLVKIGNGEC